MLWMGKSAISTGPWLQQQTVTAITRGYIHINPIYFPLNPMKSPFDPMIPGDCSIQGLKSPHGSGYPPLQPSDCRCLCLSYPSAPCMVYLAALNHFCMHINVDKKMGQEKQHRRSVRYSIWWTLRSLTVVSIPGGILTHRIIYLTCYSP